VAVVGVGEVETSDQSLEAGHPHIADRTVH
jgi:hypothetical protein